MTNNLPDPLRVADEVRAALAKVDNSVAAPPFKLHTVPGKLVRPDLDLDRTSALDTVDDEAVFAARAK
jgi:hypothetical protein